jgi:hypothetical protein
MKPEKPTASNAAPLLAGKGRGEAK